MILADVDSNHNKFWKIVQHVIERYWCFECNQFVDKGHRCEQWAYARLIPAKAIEALREEYCKAICRHCADGAPVNRRGQTWYHPLPKIPLMNGSYQVIDSICTALQPR